MSCLFHAPQNQTVVTAGSQTAPLVFFDEKIIKREQQRIHDWESFITGITEWTVDDYHDYTTLLEQPEKLPLFFHFLLENEGQKISYLNEYGSLCAAISEKFPRQLQEELLKHNFKGNVKSFIIYTLKAALPPTDFIATMTADLQKRTPSERDLKNYLFCLKEPDLWNACSADTFSLILDKLSFKGQNYLLHDFITALDKQDYAFTMDELIKIRPYLGQALYARLLVKQTDPKVVSFIEQDTTIKTVDKDIILMERGVLNPTENLEKVMNTLVKGSLYDSFFWQKVQQSFQQVQPQTAAAAFMQRLYLHFEEQSLEPARLFLLSDLIQSQHFHPTLTQKIKAKLEKNGRQSPNQEILNLILLAKAGEVQTAQNYLSKKGLELDQNLIYNNLFKIYNRLSNPLVQQELVQQTKKGLQEITSLPNVSVEFGEIFEVLGQRLPPTDLEPLIEKSMIRQKFHYSARSISEGTWQNPKLNQVFRQVCLQTLRDYDYSLTTNDANLILAECAAVQPLTTEERGVIWQRLSENELSQLAPDELSYTLQTLILNSDQNDLQKMNQLLLNWRERIKDDEMPFVTSLDLVIEDKLALALVKIKNNLRSQTQLKGN